MKKMPTKRSVVIAQYAKWPELGKVKTRLAKALGDIPALAVHLELVKCVYKNLSENARSDYQLWLNKKPKGDVRNKCSEDIKAGLALQQLIEAESIDYYLQQQGDLGAKMAGTLAQLLLEYSKVIIVGSDCPGVNTKTLDQVMDALDDYDLVIGPAEDGGYVLIASKYSHPGLFLDVDWGTPEVLRQTLLNAESAGLSYHLLAESWDVDEIEDYDRWRAS
jgi:rSAM/selenodomain-associated transferase 1